MKKLVLMALATMFVGSPWASAQIKLPVLDGKDDVRGIVFQETSPKTNLKHGMWLRIVSNDRPDKEITGVVVYANANTIALRTTPGAAPVSFDIRQIKRLDQGVIKEASFEHPVVTPEIQELVIFNGNVRSVTYRSAALSPQEMNGLKELEAAENELGRLQNVAQVETRVRENEIAFQLEHRRNLEMANWWVAQRALPWYGYYPWGYRLLDRRVGDPPRLAPDWPDLFFASMQPPFVPTSNVSIPEASVTYNQVLTARQKYQTLHRHGVYENGRLVAIVVNENEPAGTAKP